MIDGLEVVLLVGLMYFAYRNWQQQEKPVTMTDHKVILDSCALIDGRVIAIAKSGFLPEGIIIPEFILHELQLLADTSDTQKRERARFGLDVARELQTTDGLLVVVDHTPVPEKHATDDKLIALSKILQSPLYTTDFNLAKVAQIEGIKVLNVNELAQHLRPSALPGETKQVKIIQKGSGDRQGVGYLDDGTMVVVENGSSAIGKDVEVAVSRVHQTVSGKMIFAKAANRTTARAKTATTVVGHRLRKRRVAPKRVS